MANKFDTIIKSFGRWFSGDSAEALKAGRAARNAARKNVAKSQISPELSEAAVRARKAEVDDLKSKIDNFRMSDPNMLIRYGNPVFKDMSNEEINALLTAIKNGSMSDAKLARILNLPEQAYIKLNGKIVGVKQDFTKALQDFKTQLSDLHKAINTPHRTFADRWNLESAHRAAQARLSQAERLLSDVKQAVKDRPKLLNDAFRTAYDKVAAKTSTRRLISGYLGLTGGAELYNYASNHNWGMDWIRRNLDLGFNEYADKGRTASNDSGATTSSASTSDSESPASPDSTSNNTNAADSAANKGTKKSRTGAITGTLGGGIAAAILANKLAERYAKNHKTLATVGGGILGALGGGLVGNYLDKKYGA